MSVWYAYYIWICFGIKLSLKYLSFNTTAFIGSMIYHINICGELYNKQAYITVLITFLSKDLEYIYIYILYSAFQPNCVFP